MSRAYNFSAGPAALPEAVLTQARDELLDWRDSRASVMEISHRDPAFVAVAERAEADLRQLMAVPDNYRVLFLQGGATQQFALIPLNFAAEGAGADYLLTGAWGEKALKEAGSLVSARACASDSERGYRGIPDPSSWDLDDSAAYLHYTPNETIHGVEFGYVPDVSAPLVADMSSTILSRPIDVSRFGVIYAGAQKNIGPSGLTVMIIRDDLLEAQHRKLPKILDYRAHAASGSMLNTPPTFGWYLAGLVFQWLQQQGGLAAMGELNQRKSSLLYDYIGESGFYSSPVDVDARSWMNVPFTLADAELDKPFVAGAKEAGLLGLKGHRAVGGMRASIYNAMPLAGVEMLVDYMREFARQHG